MSAIKRTAGLANMRYAFTKLRHATEECVVMLSTAINQQRASPHSTPSSKSLLRLLTHRFNEAYNQRLTSVMYMAGAAMAPALNKAAIKDRDALEKLVLRRIIRPGRDVSVGDVVAFNNPLHTDSTANVMVRRVAALEGQELVGPPGPDSEAAGSDEEEVMVIPEKHCWVLADNEELKPPQVIDSRTFGPLPMGNVIGRVIYAEFAGSSGGPGPVQNSDAAAAHDAAVIQAEVEPELQQLFETSSKA